VLGLQRLGLSLHAFLARQLDAVSQGEGEQQHLQGRPDLHGIGGKQVGRQPAQVAQAQGADPHQQ